MKIGKLLQDPKYTEKFVLQKLLCLYLTCTREDLWTDVDRELDDELVQKIISAYHEYTVQKKPLEYILGHVDFFGNEFIVNEATLIPRPETEYMITAVKEYVDGKLKIVPRDSKNGKGMEGVLLDIGTGCGVLGISVLLQNPGFFHEAILTDYFANALAVAKLNYEKLISNELGIKNEELGMKVSFLQSDLLDFMFHEPLNSALYTLHSNFILVANLPYIPEGAFEQNAADNVKKWEPKPAFVGGDDGLIYYRKMFEQLFTLGIKDITMFLEMMTRQVDILRQEFGDRLEFEEVKTFHFNIRIVKCRLK